MCCMYVSHKVTCDAVQNIFVKSTLKIRGIRQSVKKFMKVKDRNSLAKIIFEDTL